MKILNLVYPEKSDIKFKRSKFPDGQQQIKIADFKDVTFYVGELPISESVEIKSRLNNFMDLELIICAVKSLRTLGVKDVYLSVPYFLGSRSDRSFSYGENNYLRDVICPIINSLNFGWVFVMDPHSDVLEGCLNNFQKQDNLSVVEYFISDTNAKLDDFVLVSPDGGSLKKIYKIAEKINYTGDILVCSKHRDEAGKLTKTHVPLTTDHNNKNLVIIDDICDGGKTFIEIAKRIKIGAFAGKLYLVVTHGIFSKGFQELSEYFDAIYTTNSYGQLYSNVESGRGSETIDQWVGPYEDQYYPEIPKGLIKQRNLF